MKLLHFSNRLRWKKDRDDFRLLSHYFNNNNTLKGVSGHQWGLDDPKLIPYLTKF